MSIVDWDATELSRAIHARQVSCEEVMQAYLAQIQRFNPSVNALVSLRDADDVLAEARVRDRELDQGQSRGWMHGFPQAIKDNKTPLKRIHFFIGIICLEDLGYSNI